MKPRASTWREAREEEEGDGDVGEEDAEIVATGGCDLEESESEEQCGWCRLKSGW